MGILSSAQFQPHEGPLDPHLDWTVGRRGAPFHDWGPHPGERWVRDQAYSGPFASKKHIWWQKGDQDVNHPSQWAPGTSYNIPIIRFADVLLMAAESEIEVGSLEQARQYINLVRERAADENAWVNNDFNREFAFEIVNSEAEMLALSPLRTTGVLEKISEQHLFIWAEEQVTSVTGMNILIRTMRLLSMITWAVKNKPEKLV